MDMATIPHRAVRTLVPAVVLPAIATAVVVALHFTGIRPHGPAWFVAGSVAGFSLSGSV